MAKTGILKALRYYSSTSNNSKDTNHQSKERFIPAAIYPNAYLNKSMILEDNKNKTGIYRWVNKVNGKTYIGSGVILARRLKEYYYFSALSKRLKLARSRIYSAILKDGCSNFRL